MNYSFEKSLQISVDRTYTKAYIMIGRTMWERGAVTADEKQSCTNDAEPQLSPP